MVKIESDFPRGLRTVSLRIERQDGITSLQTADINESNDLFAPDTLPWLFSTMPFAVSSSANEGTWTPTEFPTDRQLRYDYESNFFDFWTYKVRHLITYIRRDNVCNYNRGD